MQVILSIPFPFLVTKVWRIFAHTIHVLFKKITMLFYGKKVTMFPPKRRLSFLKKTRIFSEKDPNVFPKGQTTNINLRMWKLKETNGGRMYLTNQGLFFKIWPVGSAPGRLVPGRFRKHIQPFGRNHSRHENHPPPTKRSAAEPAKKPLASRSLPRSSDLSVFMLNAQTNSSIQSYRIKIKRCARLIIRLNYVATRIMGKYPRNVGHFHSFYFRSGSCCKTILVVEQ